MKPDFSDFSAPTVERGLARTFNVSTTPFQLGPQDGEVRVIELESQWQCDVSQADFDGISLTRHLFALTVKSHQ